MLESRILEIGSSCSSAVGESEGASEHAVGLLHVGAACSVHRRMRQCTTGALPQLHDQAGGQQLWGVEDAARLPPMGLQHGSLLAAGHEDAAPASFHDAPGPWTTQCLQYGVQEPRCDVLDAMLLIVTCMAFIHSSTSPGVHSTCIRACLIVVQDGSHLMHGTCHLGRQRRLCRTSNRVGGGA